MGSLPGMVRCCFRHRARVRAVALATPLTLALLLAGCGSSTTTTRRPTATPSATPATPTTSVAPSAGDWLRFGFDPARSGVNPSERAISPATVGGMRQRWQVTLPDVADSSPILLRGLRVPDGSTRDVLYVTTRDGRILALDAANGRVLWSHQPRGPKITHSSPVADPNRQDVYAYGLDGFVHKYLAGSGAEVTGAGWPARITTMTQTEKESSALNLANGRVLVTTSGYIGDATPYQGHVVSLDTASGAARVFNSLCATVTRLLAPGECAANRSGIWARGGAVVDPTTSEIFVTTGNGPYDANRGGTDYGDSVLALSPDGLRLLDAYTPASYQRLDENDTDLGGDAPALLPRIAQSKTPYLLVQGGKDAILRLLNRRDLSGQGGPGHTGGELQTLPSPGCGIFTQPAVWTDVSSGAIWVFVAGQCGLGAYTVVTDASGTTRLRAAWQAADARASSPVVAGGVLFAATSGSVLALDPRTGHQLWSSTQASAGGGIGGIHWESPIVTGGVLYLSDEDGHLTAYGVG
ncbi:MAG: PQQ-binding-like beta-propeller repeat protein [Ktedonobacterales bacterium]|nr:PQQ-binding-like beta-propeller repeat protein [Ktedonobacterales bacterium]